VAELSSAYAAFNDAELRARIDVVIWQEAFARYGTNDYADQIIHSGFVNFTPFYWRVSIDYDEAYETGVRSGRGAPGHDVDIITDANIMAAVNAVWPEDVAPVAGGTP